MGVGSATDGNSNVSGAGGTNAAGPVGDDKNGSGNSKTAAAATAAAPTKTSSDDVSTTHAAKTGVSPEIAKAQVQPLAFAEVAQTTTAQKVDDKKFDGHYVGADGKTYPPDTPLSEIPAVIPKDGVTNDRTIIHVNGIRTDVDGQAGSLQAVADQTGSRVIGVHNATAGAVKDIAQSLGDKVDIGKNPAVDTLADTIYNELKAGREVDLMAHSQGALVTSRALTDVRNRLQAEDGLTRQQAEAKLANVRVETFGGAARRFPDGPQYVHYVNKKDGVPQAFGLRSFLNPFARPGRGAVTHYFKNSTNPHSFDNTYLPERVPFEDARKGNFN